MDHDAPGDELGVLPRVDHPGEPVEGGVGVAAAHRLDEGGDDVVVHVAGLVVGQAPSGVRLEDVVDGDGHGVLGGGVAGVGHLARELERGERGAAVPAGQRDDRVERLVREREGPRETVGVVEGAADQRAHGPVVEGLELDDPRPRDEGGVDLEVRVLGRGADEDDGAVLDGVEQGVLLRAVEAVDLVDEEDRATARREQPALGGLDLAPEVLDRAGDGRDLHELGVRRVGDDARERRLARAGRAVQDDRRERVMLDRPAQPRALAHRLRLPHVALEGLRAHAHGERGVDVSLVALYVREEVVHANDCTPWRQTATPARPRSSPAAGRGSWPRGRAPRRSTRSSRRSWTR